VLVVGASLFTAASLACSLSTTGSLLVAARGVQGIGGALLSTSAFGSLAATFVVGTTRARAIATWASVGSFGAVAGFVAGGAITELLGWRAIFLTSVPLGALLVAAALRLLPESRGEHTVVDVPAAALATVGVATLAFVVSNGASSGSQAVLLLGLALVAFVAFAVRERRSAQPLLPAGLLRDRSFLTASAGGVAYGSSMLGVLMLLAVYLQAGRGLSALETGALLMLLRAPAIGWARLVGDLVGRFGPLPASGWARRSSRPACCSSPDSRPKARSPGASWQECWSSVPPSPAWRCRSRRQRCRESDRPMPGSAPGC